MKLYSMAFSGPKGYDRYVQGEKPDWSTYTQWHNELTPEQIKEQTGFEYDKYLGWVYEIADGEIKPNLTLKNGDWTTLGEIYDAPELYKAYPQLQRLRVHFTAKRSDSNTYASLNYREEPHYRNNYRYINEMYIEINVTKIPELYSNDFKDSLVHEVQHAIQQFEGYNMGIANPKKNDSFSKSVEYAVAFDGFHFIQSITHNLFPDEIREPNKTYSIELFNVWMKHRQEIIDWINKNCDMLFDEHYEQIQKGIAYMDKYADEDYWNDKYILYKRAKHETQARNAAKRMNMTPEERRKSLARDTEDIPIEKQTYNYRKRGLRNEEDWK